MKTMRAMGNEIDGSLFLYLNVVVALVVLLLSSQYSSLLGHFLILLLLILSPSSSVSSISFSPSPSSSSSSSVCFLPSHSRPITLSVLWDAHTGTHSSWGDICSHVPGACGTSADPFTTQQRAD